MASWFENNFVWLLLGLAGIGQSIFLPIQIRQLTERQKSLDKKIAEAKEISGKLTEVHFIKKLVKNAGLAHKRRIPALAWVPEFTYDYEVNSRSLRGQWTPLDPSGNGRAFEPIAVFGNNEAPTAQFQNYWKDYIKEKAVVPVYLDGSTATVFLTLGESDNLTSISILKVIYKVSLLLVLISAINLIKNWSH